MWIDDLIRIRVQINKHLQDELSSGLGILLWTFEKKTTNDLKWSSVYYIMHRFQSTSLLYITLLSLSSSPSHSPLSTATVNSHQTPEKFHSWRPVSSVQKNAFFTTSICYYYYYYWDRKNSRHSIFPEKLLYNPSPNAFSSVVRVLQHLTLLLPLPAATTRRLCRNLTTGPGSNRGSPHPCPPWLRQWHSHMLIISLLNIETERIGAL